jgi:ComEC/Rec2-related protein
MDSWITGFVWSVVLLALARISGFRTGVLVGLVFFAIGWSSHKIEYIRADRSFNVLKKTVSSELGATWMVNGMIERISMPTLKGGSMVLVLKPSVLQTDSLKLLIGSPLRLFIENSSFNLAIGDRVYLSLTGLSIGKGFIKAYNADHKALGIARPGLRSKIRDRVSLYLLDDAIGLFEGLLWGDTSLLSRLRYEQFKGMGLVHLLAVSGMNMGGVFFMSSLLSTGISFIPGVLRNFSFLRLMSLMYTFIGGGYLYLAGFPVGLMRAFLMGWLSLIGWAIKGGSFSFVALFVAFLGLVLINPQFLGDYSFRLSFLSTYALLVAISLWRTLSSLWLKPKWPFLCRWPVAYVVSLTFVSVFITLTLAPYLTYAFGEAPLGASLLNLLFIPLTELILFPLAFIACLLAIAIPAISEYPAWLFKLCAELTFRLMEALYPLEWLQKTSLILNLKAVHLNLYYGALLLCCVILLKKSDKWLT